ncbi:helicase associated domain-containing protein, partial [Colletotrichum scovillei]
MNKSSVSLDSTPSGIHRFYPKHRNKRSLNASTSSLNNRLPHSPMRNNLLARRRRRRRTPTSSPPLQPLLLRLHPVR